MHLDIDSGRRVLFNETKTKAWLMLKTPDNDYAFDHELEPKDLAEVLQYMENMKKGTK